MARKGLLRAKARRLGRHHPHHDAADEARSAGGGDGVEIVETELRLGQRILDQAVDALEMGARGDLRHDAAEAAVLGLLAIDDVGQDAAHGPGPGWRLDDGDGGLVAARFDAQDAHACLLKHIPSGWKQPDGICPLMQRSAVRALLASAARLR